MAENDSVYTEAVQVEMDNIWLDGSDIGEFDSAEIIQKPYTVTDAPLPKDMPKHAKRIWVSTFNSAYKSYKPANDKMYDKTKTRQQNRERYARSVAWGAVKSQYRKGGDGKWYKKPSKKKLVEDGTLEIFKVILPVTEAFVKKSVDSDEQELWLRVEGAGPERDEELDRMMPEALEKMVGYVEQGWNGQRLPYLDGHYRDLIAAELGEIYGPHINEKRHFEFLVKLDKRLNSAIVLFDNIAKGKKYGCSVSGLLHYYELEVLGDGAVGRMFFDVEPFEFSRTTWPAWKAGFTEILAKSVRKVTTDEFYDMFLRPRFERFGTNGFEKALDGLELCDGDRCSFVTIHKSRGEAMGVIEEEIEVPAVDESEHGTVSIIEKLEGEEMENIAEEINPEGEAIAEMEPVAEVTPAEVSEVMAEAAAALVETEEPEVEVAEPEAEVAELEVEPEPEAEVAELEAEPEAEVSEPEEPAQLVDVSPDMALKDLVEGQMAVRRFAVLIFSMADLVFAILGDASKSDAERNKRCAAVLDEFASLAKATVKKMVSSHVRMVSLLEPFEDLVEKGTGQLSASRIEAIKESADTAIQSILDLKATLDDEAFATKEVAEVERAVAETKETVERTSSELLNTFTKRVGELETQQADRAEKEKEVIERLAKTFVDRADEPEDPQGSHETEIPPTVEEGSEFGRMPITKRFIESFDNPRNK